MKPVTGLVVGALFVMLGLVIGLTWLPLSIADALSYGAAGPCKEPIPNGSGCWTEVSAIVTSTNVVHRGKGVACYVHLEDQFGQQRIGMAHSSDCGQLQSGQSVTARFWEGDVAAIRVPGGPELPAETEPGTQAGFAFLIAAFVLLFGTAFFLGALGVHRDQGSWTRSVARDEFGNEMWDAVAPPARRWVQAIFAIALVALFGSAFGYAFLGAPIIPTALVCAGMAALVWTWSLHHRARAAVGSGNLPSNPR